MHDNYTHLKALVRTVTNFTLSIQGRSNIVSPFGQYEKKNEKQKGKISIAV